MSDLEPSNPYCLFAWEPEAWRCERCGFAARPSEQAPQRLCRVPTNAAPRSAEVFDVAAIVAESDRADVADAWPLIKKAKSLMRETWQWVRAGMPIRTVQQREEIRGICSGCPKFRPELRACGICGCGMTPADSDAWSAKIIMGTTRCPDDPPRW